jgi:hypothetical protein
MAFSTFSISINPIFPLSNSPNEFLKILLDFDLLRELLHPSPANHPLSKSFRNSTQRKYSQLSTYSQNYFSYPSTFPKLLFSPHRKKEKQAKSFENGKKKPKKQQF